MQQWSLVGAVCGLALLLRRRKETVERQKKRRAEIGRDSSLRKPGRHVVVVATASVPWMTGTAVNPTLRAAYLAQQTDLKVTLLTPWIAVADQKELFKDHVTFATPAEQAQHIYAWVKARAGFEPSFRVVFYPAEYFRRMLGIFPIGDPTQYIPDEEADVAVLEEPEHLTWYHHGIRWTDKFPHVVGVMHTNYTELSRRTLPGPAGALVGFVSHVMNALLCSIHTHKIIKLSDAVQPLPRQATQYVHGAPGSFLKIGDEKAKAPEGGGKRFSKGTYTLGKMVWGKGWEELLDMLEQQRDRGEPLPPIDAFGSGEADQAIMERANKGQLNMTFHGRRDHLDPELRECRTFINASTSDVVATTSVEALAMGKWVIAARHPCNEFISVFANCLIYDTPAQFSAHLLHTDGTDPAPLTNEERYELSWEAATERFLDAAELPEERRPGPLVNLRDAAAFAAFNTYSAIEPLRKLAGANADTGYNPESVTDVDREQRAAKKEAARKQAASGWYRNLQGSMSFSGLSGLAVGVDSANDGRGSLDWSRTAGSSAEAADGGSGGGGGPTGARRRTSALRGALKVGTLMPPSAGPTAGE